MTCYYLISPITLFFLIVLLISCSRENTESAAEISTNNLSFKKLNEWNNSDLSVIPLPADE